MGDLDKLIVAKGIKRLPKVQLIAKSGHTAWHPCQTTLDDVWFLGTLLEEEVLIVHAQQLKLFDKISRAS